MAESFTQLASIISGNISALRTICEQNKLPLPDLDAPTFTPDSEAFRSHKDAGQAAKLAAAACLRLAAALVPPNDFVFNELAGGVLSSEALVVCLEGNVTEILREAGPKGLHVNEIAAKSGLDPLKIGRIVRFLAARHCYREIFPDVFVNNRISSMIDTGKSVEDLKADPDSKYDFTGFPALCSYRLEFDLKGGAVAWETLKDPEYGHSSDPTKTIFSKAFRTDLMHYEFLEQPEQEYRRRRFGYAMQGVAALQPTDMIFKALDWTSLPENAKVVDVGGGIGTAIMPLVQRYPKVTAVVQDLPHVVEEGKKLWTTKMPATLTSGQVKFEAHDFLTPQPVKDATVFLLKQIIHNWPVTYTTNIIRHLREAAQPDTFLVIVEYITPYACRIPPGTVDAIDGAVDLQPAPEPILPNYGPLSGSVYNLDMTMMNYFNAQEFTILQLNEILESTGWRLKSCNPIDARDTTLRSVVAVPA